MTTRDTAWAPGTPCWVDLMTTDQDAAREFYAALFGWAIEVGPEETGHYGMASLDGRSVAGIGGVRGGGKPPGWDTDPAAPPPGDTPPAGRAGRGTGGAAARGGMGV